MARTIVIEIEIDSEDPFKLIKNDIEQELNCCWHSFDKVEITEKMKGEDDD